MKLYEQSVRRKVTYLMLFIAIVGFGIVSLFQLKPELLPDITYPAVTVMQTYSGVGPVEMETLITRHIEQAVSSVNRVEKVTSFIQEGRTTTIVEFSWGTDMDAAVSDIREAMGRAQRTLPADADAPFIFKFDFSQMPIMMIGLSGPFDRARIRQLSEDIVETKLESVDGVAAVSTNGGQEREIRIELDKTRIESLQMPVNSIIGAIGNDNISRPGGNIKTESREYLLRTENEFKEIDDIEDVIVTTRGGVPIYIGDIGEVKDTFADRTNEMMINGGPGVMVTVQQRSGANTVETAGNVREALSELQRELPRGVEFTLLMDSSEFIEQSIGNLGKVAFQGGLLAVLILLFFLRNIRATLINAISIPVSIIASFTAMRLGGVTLNVMSLGGLALAVGMLVDNSVVVLENIFRHREEGQTLAESSVWGTEEVAMPIIASTLTTIAVFLPIFFVPGITGILFREQAITVTFSLTVSLFVALTLIPLLSSTLLKKSVKTPTAGTAGKITALLERMDNIYTAMLDWTLGHKKTVLLTVLAVFAGSIFAVFPLRWIPAEFMPRVDEGNVDINIELPVGTRLEKTIEKSKEIEKIVVKAVDEIESVRTRVGPGGFVFGGRSGSHVSQIGLTLVPASERRRSQDNIISALRPNLASITGAKIRISGRGGGMRMGSGGSPIEVEIYGYDIDTARKLSEQIGSIIEDTPGASDVQIGLEDPRLEYVITADRRKAGALGLSPRGVATQVESYVLGQTVGYFRTGEDEHPITVRLKEEDRGSLMQINNLPALSPGGQAVPLKSIVDIFVSAGPVSISRQDQRRRTTVTANYTGRDLAGVSRQIEKAVGEIDLPEDFTIVMGGETREQRESFFWLALAFLGAILLVYMVMASQFESLLDPFIVLFTIPMALIGVIWMLFFTGTSLSVISLIGVIMLTGIVVNNSIVLIDYINLLRERGLELKAAVMTGGRKRLRPVLMTALTTMLAMTPMALGLGEGAEMSYPIARSLIGGLIAATFLTLLVIPVIYTIFEKRRKRKEERI
ncbi:MAG: efflux RND transporter permease subunit [Elusimicrobiota bacterium]|nr:efflux RND transporter permease subunit [Elusimicrobiota bacterium]